MCITRISTDQSAVVLRRRGYASLLVASMTEEVMHNTTPL